MNPTTLYIAEMIGHAIKWVAVLTFVGAVIVALTGNFGAALALGLLWFALSGTCGALLTAVEEAQDREFMLSRHLF